jgi:NAD(P)H-flavin reductase
LSSPVTLPAVKPGQFLHLALDPYDPGSFWPESRIFSIAKVNRETNSLTLCYSVKGIFTSRMQAELSVGKPVWIKLPFGDFVVASDAETVLIAGGTGITPFVQHLAANHEKPCMLVYGARDKAALLFKQEIDQAVLRHPLLRTFYFVEETEKDTDLLSGRLNINWILEQTVHLNNPVFYLSGPPIMIKMFTKDLLDNSIQAGNIRTDAWE